MRRPIPVHRPVAVACALGLVMLGCGSSETNPLLPCSGPVTMAISSGQTPQISWSPACSAAQLIVFTPPSLGAAETTWWYIRSSTADIRPPVQYGTTPPGATVLNAAQPLDAQRSINAVVSDASGNVLGVGVRNP